MNAEEGVTGFPSSSTAAELDGEPTPRRAESPDVQSGTAPVRMTNVNPRPMQMPNIPYLLAMPPYQLSYTGTGISPAALIYYYYPPSQGPSYGTGYYPSPGMYSYPNPPSPSYGTGFYPIQPGFWNPMPPQQQSPGIVFSNPPTQPQSSAAAGQPSSSSAGTSNGNSLLQ